MTKNQISKEQTGDPKINLFHSLEDPQFFSLYRHLNKCFSFLSGIFVELFGLEDNFCAKAHLGPLAHFLGLLTEHCLDSGFGLTIGLVLTFYASSLFGLARI